MIEAFCHWLSATALSQGLAGLAWFVPLTQSVHILGLAALVTALAFVQVQVLRGGAIDGPALAARFAPQVHAGLGLLAATGLLLVVVEPARELLNTAFRIKLLVLLPLLLLGSWHTLARLRASAQPSRAAAVLNLLLLVALIGLGRFIAYI